MSSKTERRPIEVRAAGGVVWRDGADGGRELAVVYRPKYDDWTLPKGKLDPGETWEQAALREVEEETGLRCELDGLAGDATYCDPHGREKLVRYWNMRLVGGAFRQNDEVADLRWVPPQDALELLSHDRDRELLKRLDP